MRQLFHHEMISKKINFSVYATQWKYGEWIFYCKEEKAGV